jgi:predicted DNA-binding transcriptional regulator AlpA
MARPSKYTPELQRRVCLLIAAGNTVAISVQAAGVARRTFYNWMNDDRLPYVSFQAAVASARGESEAMLVSRVARAASAGSWRAAAWLLERRFPERWSKKVRS